MKIVAVGEKMNFISGIPAKPVGNFELFLQFRFFAYKKN